MNEEAIKVVMESLAGEDRTRAMAEMIVADLEKAGIIPIWGNYGERHLGAWRDEEQ